MSATTHTGISAYTFPASNGEANIIIDASSRITDFNQYAGYVKTISSTKLEGSSLSGDFCFESKDRKRTIYFAMEFSKSATTFGLSNNYKSTTGIELNCEKAGAYYRFKTEANETIFVKTGISYVSTSNAWLNLQKEEPGWAFRQIKQNAYTSWNTELSRIEVKGGTKDDKINFYTGIYHMLLHPNVFNDVNGQYPSMGHKEILKIKGSRYTGAG